jgi:chromate reductase
MRILAVCGSPGPQSSNRALLRAAADVAGRATQVVDGPELATLPHFAPGPDPVPAAVEELRIAVSAADGVLIASPEYAHSLPGSLKNALDWLVGSGEFYGKPVAVLAATPRHGGGGLGRAALEQVLHALGADVRYSASVLVSGGADPGGAGRAEVADALLRLGAAVGSA